MAEWGSGSWTRPLPFPILLEIMEEYDDEENEQTGLTLPSYTDLIAIALTDDLLGRLDHYLFTVQENPEYPESLKGLPLWALRSNFIIESIEYRFEVQELNEMWREEL